jgi:hypothetical protein
MKQVNQNERVRCLKELHVKGDCGLLSMKETVILFEATPKALGHQGVWGSECIDPCFLELGTSCRWDEAVALSVEQVLTVVNLGFLGRSHYCLFHVAPQLSPCGCVDPVPDPLFFRKSGIFANRTRDLRICSHEILPLDHKFSPARPVTFANIVLIN